MDNRAVFLFLTVLLVASGCVSGPTSVRSDEKPESVPDWVLTRPQDDATYKYFVGSGTSNGGDQAEARSIAGGDIYGAIQRFIGVDVSSVTESKAKASLDSYKTSITQTVTQKGAALVVGFEITQTWIDERRKPAVTVYILARYDKKELAKEKARQEKLRDEALKAIEGPEAEGLELTAQGRYYEAAQSFITAASNALNSRLENKEIRFKRNIDHALDAVDRINLVKLNDNLQGMVGQPFPEALRLKVTSGATASDPGVPGVKLEVGYREFHKPTGKMRPKSTEITTDESGYADFEHPVPDFVGESEIRVALILDAAIEGIAGAPQSQKELVNGLEERIARKRAIVQIQISSDAKNIKTGVIVIDYDSEGNLAGITESSSSLKSILYDFNLMDLSLNRSEISEKNEADLSTYLKEKYGDKVERVLLGTIRITGFTKSGSRVLAKATGTVQVIDMKTGSTLLTSQKLKNGMGNTEGSAASQAYKEIGKLFGQDIRNNLK